MSVYDGLTEAVTQGFISQMNPMNAIVRQLAEKQLASAEDELIRTVATTVELIEQKKLAATNRGADAAVIGAYDKLLARAYGNS